MKRKIQIFALMLMGIMLSSNLVWAESVTFTWNTNPSAYTSGSTSFSQGIVTFTGTKGTGFTATRAWSDGLRIYAGGTAQFSVPNGYVITAISGYSAFSYSNATGEQTVLFSGLSKGTCSNDVTVTYKSNSPATYTLVFLTQSNLCPNRSLSYALVRP